MYKQKYPNEFNLFPQTIVGVRESPRGFSESCIRPDANVHLETSAINVLFIAGYTINSPVLAAVITRTGVGDLQMFKLTRVEQAQQRL